MRPHLASIAALAVILSVASCAPKTLSPKRPAAVPKSATFVDAADGGGWVDCQKVANSPNFDCSIFNYRDGSLHAKGSFAPDFDAKGVVLQFTSYDGGGRLALSDTTHLGANGVVDFPAGDGHGHRMKYRFGEPVGPDSTY